MKKSIALILVLILALAVLPLSGCGGSDGDSVTADTANTQAQAEETKNEVTTVVIGVASGSGASQFLDEDDNLTGSDVELLRAVDELLPDYEFEFVVTEMNDVLVGLQNGTYDGGICNWLLTAERVENYKYGEPLGAFYVGILVRKENADILTLDDFAAAQEERGLTMYDAQSGNGVTYVLEVYNQEHPDNPIEFNYTTEGTNLNGISTGWVVDGHFDAALLGRSTWEELVESEDGAYHEYIDELSWAPTIAANTYCLFNKSNVSDEFIEAYSAALRQLKEDGTASEISIQFYGYDIYNFDTSDLAGD